MVDKNRKIFIVIGSIVCLVLVLGIVFLNISDKDSTISNIKPDIDIEKEKANIPAIKVNENKDYQETEVLNKESINNEMEVEVDKDKETIEKNTKNVNTNINPISKPKKEKLPEEMEKPITQPKPKEPPKSIVKEIKDKDKAPTTKEEPKKEVKGGTGTDGVVRDLKGNPTGLKPAENIEEIKGSDLGNPDENMGEGDKF